MKVHIHVHLDAATRRRKRNLLWDIGPVSEQRLPGLKRAKKKMLRLTTTQQSPIAINAVDRKNKPAQVDSIVFTSSDESVATVTADPSDPSKALIKAGNPGTAQINVAADADLGDGIAPLGGSLDVTVVASQAVSLAITTGTPEEQPE